jgi:c-di-AMP phosphodiesterase-like protein
MAKETTTPASEKLYLWLKLAIIILTALFALIQEFTIKTFLILLIFVFVFFMNTLYNWKVKADDKLNNENYNNFANWLIYSRRTFIILSFLIPLLCIGFAESYKYFPKWQQQFIYEHFTSEEKLIEFYPLKISNENLANHPDLIKQKDPMLVVNHSSTLYFFDNAKINGEMIRYAGDNFHVFALVLASLLGIFTIIFILIDFVGSFQYSLSKQSSETQKQQ